MISLLVMVYFLILKDLPNPVKKGLFRRSSNRALGLNAALRLSQNMGPNAQKARSAMAICTV
jgi:hypothetical protein